MPPQDTQLGPQDAAGPVEKAEVNRPNRLAQWVGLAAFALMVALSIAAGIAQARDSRDDSLRPGNCVKIDATDERYLIRVPCTESSAQLRVTSRHDNTSDVDAACPRNAAAEPGYAFVEEQSDKGIEVNFVLCVAPR